MSSHNSDTIQRRLAAETLSAQGDKAQDSPPAVVPNVLIPLAKHTKAKAGMEFVSHFFTAKEAIKLTLMHIPPSQAAVWVEETSYESLDVLETRTAAADQKGRAVVEHASRQLQLDGFPAHNIEIKVARPQMSKANDIIREARAGMYDAVVLGRRVQEGLADVMDQSVCRELLEGLSHAISFPLWFCRLPERERKDVLLCVDGSAPSDRIADHVGFMLSHEPGHTVTIFHVHDPSKSDPLDAEAVVEQTEQILLSAGMAADRIKREIRRGTNATRLIKEEYAANNFASVAIGSAGSDRGFWNKLFVGSVAQAVFKDLQGAALWVCF